MLALTDINECQSPLTCNPLAICNNTVGSYSCKCRAGFAGNGFLCSGNYGQLSCSQSKVFTLLTSSNVNISHCSAGPLHQKFTKQGKMLYRWFFFLQRGRIACYAERCISHGNSTRLSLCLSVTRWYPIQTNKNRIKLSSLWGSKNTLVFRYEQWLGQRSLSPKICVQSDPPPLKSADFGRYLLITYQHARASEKFNYREEEVDDALSKKL